MEPVHYCFDCYWLKAGDFKRGEPYWCEAHKERVSEEKTFGIACSDFLPWGWEGVSDKPGESER